MSQDDIRPGQVAKWQSLDLPQGAASVLGRSTRSLTMIILTCWIMGGFIGDNNDNNCETLMRETKIELSQWWRRGPQTARRQIAPPVKFWRANGGGSSADGFYGSEGLLPSCSAGTCSVFAVG